MGKGGQLEIGSAQALVEGVGFRVTAQAPASERPGEHQRACARLNSSGPDSARV